MTALLRYDEPPLKNYCTGPTMSRRRRTHVQPLLHGLAVGARPERRRGKEESRKTYSAMTSASAPCRRRRLETKPRHSRTQTTTHAISRQEANDLHHLAMPQGPLGAEETGGAPAGTLTLPFTSLNCSKRGDGEKKVSTLSLEEI
ncbi:hypothetical protein PAHAL_4G037100 [Panicum hallii]|jgi:hypothetical protein|uniref:Uncharacterized protein n=1 Tax=Panicum hallii TaxID=206008 RepID=A0A2S3HHC3_9POAL|nr:hypothetical protein PAHAL_4G037100 [Panicum hallii]